ncbi:MAG: RNA 2',3'-cyclic phosphodiesterase [Patescibacteria group bacterium]
MNKKRLFIAINLPETVKDKLFDWELKLEKEYELGEFRGKNINWVIKKNLHITLVFIGNATDDETYGIAKTIRDVAKNHQQFFVNLDKIILGPSDGSARMFWAQGGKSQELAELQFDLEESLDIGDNPQKEARAFSPHVTLARLKSNVSKIIKEKGIIEKKINYQIPIESIELMQSTLGRSGPEYTTLELVELGK